MSKFEVIYPFLTDEVKACIREMYKGIQRYGWELKEYGYEEDTKTQYYILSREDDCDWLYVNLFVDKVGYNSYINHQDDVVLISYHSDNGKMYVGELNAITEFIEYVGTVNCLELLKEESDDQNRKD